MINIIIPVYNVEEYLPRCLESVINQTSSEFKAILVDDGSMDGCGKICDDVAMIDNRFITLHKKNGGLVSAVKYGIEHSPICDYYMFLDADDTLELNTVEKVTDIIKMYSPEMIMFDLLKCFDSGLCTVISTNLFEGMYNRNELNRLKEQYVSNGVMVSSRCNKVFKADIVRHNLNYYDDKVSMAEDVLFTITNLFCVESMYYLKVPFYHYYQNASSMVHKYKESYLESYKIVHQRMSEYFNDNLIANAIFFRHIKTLIHLIVLYGSSNKYIHEELDKICKDGLVVEVIEEYKPIGIKNKIIKFGINNRLYWMLKVIFILYNIIYKQA